jgi:putative lipoprotein
MRAIFLCLCVSLLLPLPASAQRVTGTATKRDRMALPPEAVFEAKVEDVSRVDAAATVIGSVRIENPGQVPISFAIDVDPKLVVPSNTYAVRATITIGGRLRYTTDTRHPVLTRGAGTHVDIVLTPVPSRPDQTPSKTGTPSASTLDPGPATPGATTPGTTTTGAAVPGTGAPAAVVSTPSLEDTNWKLTQLGGQPVVPAENQRREAGMTLRSTDRRVSISGGCNQMVTGYSLEGNALTFGKVAGTLMACPSGMDTERAMSEALPKVATWKLLGQILELSDAQGQVLARFEATAAPVVPAPQPR